MKVSKKAQLFITTFSTEGWAAKVAAERSGELRYVQGWWAADVLTGFGQKWLVESIEIDDLTERHVLSVHNGQDWMEVASYLRQYQEVA